MTQIAKNLRSCSMGRVGENPGNEVEATAYPKHQNFSSEITTVGTSRKRPRQLFSDDCIRIFHCSLFLLKAQKSDHIRHGLRSMFVVYATVLRECDVLF